jgi:hypothetical protein
MTQLLRIIVETMVRLIAVPSSLRLDARQTLLGSLEVRRRQCPTIQMAAVLLLFNNPRVV